jgi:hypothetical protein
VKIYNFKKNSKIKGDFGGFQLPEGEREREREGKKKKNCQIFIFGFQYVNHKYRRLILNFVLYMWFIAKFG